jgi:hypothetical protein
MSSSPLVDVALVEKWMWDHNYLILHSDKNLGAAVVGRDWAFNLTRELVDNLDQYIQISVTQARALLAITKTNVIHLSSAFPEGSQLREFIASNAVNCDANILNSVPRFYGIPKIHKEPWKMRPICPGYSALANPASKFVHKEIQGILLQCPFVIHGSKHFAKVLADVRLPANKKCWIIVGDVVAYYPTIDTDAARQIVSGYMDIYLRNELSYEGDVLTKAMEVFNFALEVALEQPVITFLEKYYRQRRGLPMGWAASPAIANIYGSFYEELQVEAVDRIVFYGRYIDDIFAIVHAASAEDARTLLADTVKIGPCQITWDQAGDAVDFLDMHVWLSAGDNVVHTSPYAKKMSHHERIPWASHHPADVKRGTFIGELTRLATLSSEFVTYNSAVKSLADLYCGRGYPPNLIKSWVNRYGSERWHNRLSDREEDAGKVLAIKSTFNPVWSFVQAKELQAVLQGGWYQAATQSIGKRAGSSLEGRPRKRLRHSPHDGLPTDAVAARSEGNSGAASEDDASDGVPSGFAREPVEDFLDEILQRRVLVSRKRNTQLWDLTRAWNKAQLEVFLASAASEDPDLFCD